MYIKNIRIIGILLLVTYLISCRDTQFTITNEGSSVSGSTQSATVAGKVTDVLGNPIEGVEIVTLPFGRDVTRDDIGRKSFEHILTDSEGNYKIVEQPQGTYKLLFLASGFIKGSLTIGPVDFNPDNLVSGEIKKSIVLSSFTQLDDGDIPSVALFDPEDKKRMTEILTANGIRYTTVINNISSLNRENFNVLVVGLDATVYQDIEQLINNKQVLDNFLAEGGSIYLGQLNDFSFEATPLSFLTGDQQFILHTEGAPFNDFTSGKVIDSQHPLVAGVSFNQWHFVEAGQQTIKENVTFDAAIKNSFDLTNWNIIVTTPAEAFTSGNGSVNAEDDVIIAEYTDPRSGAHIVVNQAAFYQATFGDVTEERAILLTNNVVNYIKFLNHN